MPQTEPTPAEIRRECERIQAGWTRDEERRHRVTQQRPAEFPVAKSPKVL